MTWDVLTPAEGETYSEYTRLRQLSDWAGFDNRQAAAKDAAGAWIAERRAYIIDLANGDVPGKEPGWDTADRKQRYDYLGTTASGSPHALCQLPTEAGTDTEKAVISEREMWWRIPSTEYTEQSKRRQACTDWLIARRKYVWNLAEGNIEDAEPGWDHADRRQRYANLQIATKYGSAYDDWLETHDAQTGAELGGGNGSSREKALAWMSKHLGCYESPDGSNSDSRSDGIHAAQRRCANGATYLDNQPWCGVWCWNALDHAGVRNLDPNIASVAWCEDQARACRAPFTGYTTDGSKARPGDLVIMFGYGGHVGMLRATPTGSHADTAEGNTANTSANRERSRSADIRGYCLVAYP